MIHLGTEGKKYLITALITRSLPAFTTLFESLLYLKNEEIPKQSKQIFAKAATTFGFDNDIFIKLQKVKDKSAKYSTEEMRSLMDSYIWEVRKITEAVDKL